ncbi:MAG TPA: hypothetical protein VI583_17070, partial [Cyclobacteriaceae bacterium]|nr:hypothetical protein [Cyclobacteriaceae bacterium]
MNNPDSSPASTIRILRWIPRVVSILLIGLFLVLFIGEGGFGKKSFESYDTKTVAQLLLQAIVLIGYVIAWKNELIGGLLALLAYLGIGLINHRIFEFGIMYLFPL